MIPMMVSTITMTYIIRRQKRSLPAAIKTKLNDGYIQLPILNGEENVPNSVYLCNNIVHYLTQYGKIKKIKANTYKLMMSEIKVIKKIFNSRIVYNEKTKTIMS